MAAVATVLGLGALGGVALGTNPGTPVPTARVRTGSGAIVTGASGTALPASQPALVRGPTTRRPVIVTRASGGGAVALEDFDD
ncbi:MAG TPA: hypothetical protein VGF04_04035 [Solirubrobacterales bacterium]|jgi:hypothetical protein